MPTGVEFYDPSGRLLFNSDQPPYIYMGKVSVGPNAGTIQRGDAFNRDGLAPQLSGTELVNIQAPTGSLLVAATGNKLATQFSVFQQNGQTRCAFLGSTIGSGTLYFFGPHPGTSTTNQGLQFYDRTGKVIFETSSRAMRIVPADGASGIAIPSGKTYAVMVQQYGVNVGNVFVGPSSQGNRQYTRFYSGCGYTDGGTASYSTLNTDLVQYAAGDDSPFIRRANFGLIIDVTNF